MKRYQTCFGLGVLCLFLSMIALPVVAQDATASNSNFEIIFWESVRDSNNIDMYRAYVKKFPNGNFVSLAKIKINALSTDAPKNAKPVHKAPMPAKSIHLRSKTEKYDERDLQDFIKKYNFSVPKRNPDGRFENAFVDNQDGTITDETTGLIWQKSSSNQKLYRYRANKYIETLNWEKFAGRSNWRLPTLEELLSLVEREPQAPLWFHIDPIFHNSNRFMADSVWSTDEREPAMYSKYGGWVVNFWSGTILQAHWGTDVSVQQEYEENEENFVKAVCSK